MSSVQIPEELFLDLIRWHLLDLHDPDLQIRIQTGLQDKLDRAAARVEYSRRLSKQQTTLR